MNSALELAIYGVIALVFVGFFAYKCATAGDDDCKPLSKEDLVDIHKRTIEDQETIEEFVNGNGAKCQSCNDTGRVRLNCNNVACLRCDAYFKKEVEFNRPYEG